MEILHSLTIDYFDLRLFQFDFVLVPVLDVSQPAKVFGLRILLDLVDRAFPAVPINSPTARSPITLDTANC